MWRFTSRNTNTHWEDTYGHFHEFEWVVFKEDMSVEQAISILAKYHGATKESVVSAFTTLNWFEWAIQFVKTLNSWYDCIAMRWYETDDRLVHTWSLLIDLYTWHPQMRCW